MKIAILGLGIEGKSAEKYFTALGDEVAIFDRFTEKDIDNFGLENFDLVIRTPSIRPRPNWSSVTKIFFDKCPCPIIGVTGTKGKGTTVSLIASILKSSGKKVHLVGNIGISPLDILSGINPTDTVVFELSSFQLWDLQKSPSVAVLTHLDIDHLDVHTDKKEYWDAKSNITKHQAPEDYLIYERDNKIATAIAETSSATKLTYPTDKFDSLLASLLLPGQHNRRNAEAAILASLAVLDSLPPKKITPHLQNAITTGLSDFAGLPHRLKFIGKIRGIKYYDDSISTTPGSAIAAIKAFAEPKILILGGSSKGADFSELAESVKSGNIKKIILMGPEGDKIKVALDAVGYTDIIKAPSPYTMPDIVKITTENTAPGDIVILSPAAASFDNFKNYADRGEQFISAVVSLL